MLSVLLHVGVYFANGGLAGNFDVQDSAWVALHDWPLLVLLNVYTHTYTHMSIHVYVYVYTQSRLLVFDIALRLLLTLPGKLMILVYPSRASVIIWICSMRFDIV